METQEIIIKLPLKAWNVVVNALGQRPFGEVADIISSMRAQAEPQIKPPPAPLAQETPKVEANA